MEFLTNCSEYINFSFLGVNSLENDRKPPFISKTIYRTRRLNTFWQELSEFSVFRAYISRVYSHKAFKANFEHTLNQKRNLIYFFLLEDEQGADYDDNDLLDALADIVIDRQEKVLLMSYYLQNRKLNM